MRFVVFLTLILASVVMPLWADSPAKKRVAVLDFDNAAVRGVSSPFYQIPPPNVGKAVVDLLIHRLVQSGACSIIERAAIEAVLAEQNLSNSDRFDPQTAAKLGRLLGVDAIILGSITKYDRDDKTTGTGRSVNPFSNPALKIKHDVKAAVEISTRIVSPDTAEIIAVAQGAGMSERKGVKSDVRDRPAMMITQQGPIVEVMNEAVDKAVKDLTTKLEGTLTKIPARLGVIEGLVADANASGRLILNVGARAGVKSGDRVQVWRAGKPIPDPATGKVLRYDDTLLGDAIVTSVDEVSAVAKYSGTDLPSPGDRVKSPPRP
jgi:curli biogenesis system outer membrane secretion channel CsgG